VKDLVSALAAIKAAGLDVEAAAHAMAGLAPTRMRLDVRQGEGTAKVIDDSYNASPASMAESLDVLCRMSCAGRRIAVLGEMGELGSEGERLHAMVAAYAAAKPLDLLVLVGGRLADVMREAALTMGLSADCCERFSDALEAARVIGPILSDQDLVLVKASRAVGLDRFVQEVVAS